MNGILNDFIVNDKKKMLYNYSNPLILYMKKFRGIW